MPAGEDERNRLRGREEPKPRVVRDLAVDQRDELVLGGRLVEPRVQILEQALRHAAEHIQLVDGTE